MAIKGAGNPKAVENLLTRLRDGDPDAFEQVYLKWHKPVYLLMFKITRSESDAEDIAQDVFTHLWANRERIEPSRNIKALIFLMARRSAARLSRRNGLHTDYLSDIDTSPPLDNDPGELMMAEELRLMALYAIEMMPPRQREAYELYYEGHLTYDEIAGRLGIPVRNVRQHVHNAKKFIRGLLSFITVVFLS